MNTLSDDLSNITNEWKILQVQWKLTCQSWNDSTRQRFEREFWREYDSLVNAYLRRFQDTTDLINSACQELEL